MLDNTSAVITMNIHWFSGSMTSVIKSSPEMSEFKIGIVSKESNQDVFNPTVIYRDIVDA